MRIVNVSHQDDCLGSVSNLQLTFDQEFSEQLILALNSIGSLEFHRTFARPFYQLRGRRGFVVKGLQGENTCVLIVLNDSVEEILSLIEQALSIPK